MKSYNLYLDDERLPKTKTPFFIARSYEDFVYTITTHGIPQYISFDHDLGLHSGSGYECVIWFTGWVLGMDNKLPYNFNYNVHSANPVGTKRIVQAMENLIKQAQGE